jgi:hypothetical protein
MCFKHYALTHVVYTGACSGHHQSQTAAQPTAAVVLAVAAVLVAFGAMICIQ